MFLFSVISSCCKLDIVLLDFAAHVEIFFRRQAPSLSLFLVESQKDTDRSLVVQRVSVARAHDLLVLSMNHVLPVTSDSRVEWGGEMQYGLWMLDNHLFSPKI